MKLMKKNIVAMIISIIFIFPVLSGSAFVFAFGDSATEKENKWINLLDANGYCASLYFRMIQNFKDEFEDIHGRDNLDFETAEQEIEYFVRKDREILPEDYAGAYIDDENLLHVIIVGEGNKKKYMSIFASEDSRVVYEYANVSLKTLLTIQEKLDSVMQDFCIVSTATDEINNGLIINLLDMSRKKEVINHLELNISDLPIENLYFNKSLATVPTATAASGTNITNSSLGTNHMTVGYNAYRSSTGQYGVVTAGHGTIVGQKMYNAGHLQIGTTSLRQYKTGTIDAAFVPFSNGFTPSSEFKDTVTSMHNVVVGMTTHKRGIINSYNTGTLIHASVTASCDGYTFTNQVQISNTQEVGDSGGPVWVVFGNIKTLYGIATFKTQNNQAVASRVSNINAAFGLSTYYQ